MTSESQPSRPDQPAADDLLRKGADKAIKTGLAGWWEDRSETEKAATALITFALAIGPLGMGFFAAIGALYKGGIPGSQQFEALWWLMIIAAPLFAFVGFIVWLPGKHSSLPVAAGVAAIAAVGASWLVSQSPAPTEMGGLYCYAGVDSGGIAYEQACRAFDNAGFIAENQARATPTGSADVFASAFVYTADARGVVMAIAAMLAAAGVGLLLRENT